MKLITHLISPRKQLLLSRCNIIQPLLIENHQIKQQQQYGMGRSCRRLQEVCYADSSINLWHNGDKVVDDTCHVDDWEKIPVVQSVVVATFFWWGLENIKKGILLETLSVCWVNQIKSTTRDWTCSFR